MMNKEYKRTDSMIDDPSRWDIKKIDPRISIVIDENRYTEAGRLHVYHIQAEYDTIEESDEILKNIDRFIHIIYGFISENPLVNVCHEACTYEGIKIDYMIVLRFFDDDHKKLARYRVDPNKDDRGDCISDLYDLEGYIFYRLSAMSYGVLDRDVDGRVTAYSKDTGILFPEREIHKYVIGGHERAYAQDRKEVYNINLKISGSDCIKTILMSYDGERGYIDVIADESILYMLNLNLHLINKVTGIYIY